MISYEKFLSLSPTLHQVCSSDYVNQSWITLLSYFGVTSGEKQPFDYWRGLGDKHFRLLSALCQLANQTITDTIHRFHMQSFITANVLTELDFYAQLNTTYHQFIQSLLVDFSMLVDIVHLFNQVDQPLTLFDNGQVILSDRTNQTDSQAPFQVSILDENWLGR